MARAVSSDDSPAGREAAIPFLLLIAFWFESELRVIVKLKHLSVANAGFLSKLLSGTGGAEDVGDSGLFPSTYPHFISLNVHIPSTGCQDPQLCGMGEALALEDIQPQKSEDRLHWSWENRNG